MTRMNKTNSKDKLIEAAIVHLGTEGLNNFTATALTKAANLGYGTFYKYFSSTEDLLEVAIKKNVMDRSFLLSKSNKNEPDRLLAFLEGVYKTIIELSNNTSMKWLLEKPNYFVEVYYEHTRDHAREDVELAVASGQLSRKYLDNFDTKFKLYLWQICGGLSLIDQGYNYKDIALELIRLIIPNNVNEQKVEEICQLLESRNEIKLKNNETQ